AQPDGPSSRHQYFITTSLRPADSVTDHDHRSRRSRWSDLADHEIRTHALKVPDTADKELLSMSTLSASSAGSVPTVARTVTATSGTRRGPSARRRRVRRHIRGRCC